MSNSSRCRWLGLQSWQDSCARMASMVTLDVWYLGGAAGGLSSAGTLNSWASLCLSLRASSFRYGPSTQPLRGACSTGWQTSSMKDQASKSVKADDRTSLVLLLLHSTGDREAGCDSTHCGRGLKKGWEVWFLGGHFGN